MPLYGSDVVDDAGLVLAARAGDRDAFAAIFDRYAPRVHAFCTRMLNEPHTAADATQDTFVAAAQRLDQLRDPSRLRAWLYAIARNECTRHGRARGRAVPTEDSVMTGHLSDGGAPTDAPAEAAAAAEVGELLWDAAAGLDDQDRLLLELHVRHGLEGAELAEAAGVAPGQISMVTGRMRERVARAVGALLIARKGREDCPGLQVVLADWDGTFSVLTRKRVARHIDRCEVCDERRAALVAPLGTLAIAPAVVAFTLPDGALDGVRDRVLEAFDQRGAGGAGGAGHSGHRRRVVLVGLVAALVLLAMLAVVVADGDDGDPSSLAAGSSSTSLAAPASTTAASSSTTTPSGDPSVPATSPVEGVTTTVVGVTTTVAVGGPVATTAPPIVSPPVTLSPPVTTPNAAPSVGATSRSGSGPMQTSCNPANDTRTISVSVSDDRAVSSVVLRWSGPGGGSGQRSMVRSGATWSATLGPFPTAGTVSYRAVATDADGASAASPTASVAVEPCPG